MGGNVFPGMNRRYDRKEYLDLIDELKPILEQICVKYNVCPSMENKESFGDMDIVCVPSKTINWNEFVLCDIFETKLCKRNGSTWSLIYKEFQLDLIMSPEKEYEFCCNYMGMGDRGNFVGKLAHQLGLKFGHDGLWIPVRKSDSHKLGEVLLTLDPIKAERFLDVEPMKYANRIEDVFLNISRSKYFNPEIFLLENNNAIARVRDKKRPNYNLFLEWCTKLPKKDYFVKSKNKKEYLEIIFEEFPDAVEEYNELWYRATILDRYSELFNGKLVSEWTGLQGKELGEFIVKIKDVLDPLSIVWFMSAEDVKEFVLYFYANMLYNNLSSE